MDFQPNYDGSTEEPKQLPARLPFSLLNGAILLDNGAALPIIKADKFAAHAWQFRGWAWVDPLKDVETAREGIALRITSRSRIAREQGREQGRRQGEETGMAKLLHRQIEQRFGPLPEWADARIRGASGAEREQWAGNVLTASTLESALGR